MLTHNFYTTHWQSLAGEYRFTEKFLSELEQTVKIGEELLARKNNADTISIGLDTLVTALIKVINIRLPQGQKITRSEMVTAIKEEII